MDTPSSVSAELLNAGFIERLETEGPTKTAAQSLNYIKDRLREASFMDMIIPNDKVVRGDLQRSTEHDTMVKIVDIEPGSRAMALTFRGQPDATYVNGKRFAIAFFTISSQRFEIVENELMAYEMPVTKIIEENSLKDMVELKDREGISHIASCVEAMQEEGNGGAVAFTAANVTSGAVIGVSKVKGSLALASSTTDFTVHPIQKPDIIKIKKLLKQQIVDASGAVVRQGRLRPVVMLMTETDADDMDAWTIEDVGSNLAGETTKEGYTYNKAVGLRIIRTIKNDILRQGNLFVFTAPDYFGRNYTLNDVKFYIDKIANRIFWQAWMDVGMGFANIAAVVKLELYSGSVTPGAETTGYEQAVPVEVEALGAQNNKADEGLTFPRVNLY